MIIEYDKRNVAESKKSYKLKHKYLTIKLFFMFFLTIIKFKLRSFVETIKNRFKNKIVIIK